MFFFKAQIVSTAQRIRAVFKAREAALKKAREAQAQKSAV